MHNNPIHPFLFTIPSQNTSLVDDADERSSINMADVDE